MSDASDAPRGAVGWRDADGLVHLSDGEPGPAGAASLDLADGGVQLTVDYEDPAHIVRLVLDGPTPAQLEALARVVGWTSLALIDEVDAVEGVELPFPVGAKLGGRWLHPLVALVVVTADIAERPLGDAGLALALLEAAELIDQLATSVPALVPHLDADAARRRGARLLVGADGADIGAAVAQRGEGDVARLLVAAAGRIDGTDADILESLARTLGDDGRVAMSALGGVDEMALASIEAPRDGVVPPRGRQHLDVEVVVDPALDAEPVAAWRGDHHLEVSARTSGAAPVWLRVTRVADHGTPVPLALVPFAHHDIGVAHAAALLADAEPVDELVIEITATPTELRLPDVLHTVRAAATLGREAVRAQRDGDRLRARALWARCAEAWVAAGDDARAAEAHDRADELAGPAVGTPRVRRHRGPDRRTPPRRLRRR